MAYWLLKSEPGSWSWTDQLAAHETRWDGVRNAQALGNMCKMAPGDRAFFYHSGKERAIVGLVAISRSFYPDPEDAKSGLVDVTSVQSMPQPVPLSAIKADPAFESLALVRQPRLSVMPVPDDLAQKLLKMAGL
ncbi:ubiquinol-cytochrome c reductase [Iodidimonas muriae]|uniref:Ubiquinol-cytochrome c reductase n=1 Tax=Iodidimonas muriae TaxID=261467 RepID=A0ABQ2L9V7_9PROT|nr:EVE domain-containing protein [Iodidimonas muriae]GER06035.1 ubiquinol-cytochrome c reductase [Kordiimonadales bacterium JCM 17843]GGO07971.1 ubiquinol-cytochrome c reductase [Iodidimonas muriae]